MSRSSREQHFLTLWRAMGIPGWEPVEQFRFAPPRQWRFDAAFISAKVGIELQGGEFSGGRHGRGRGMMDDAEKARAAARLGWIVLPIVGTELTERPWEVIADVRAVLELRSGT